MFTLPPTNVSVSSARPQPAIQSAGLSQMAQQTAGFQKAPLGEQADLLGQPTTKPLSLMLTALDTAKMMLLDAAGRSHTKETASQFRKMYY